MGERLTEIDELIEITEYDVTGKLVINKDAREWCKMKYPDHPNGCPNYGEKEECPPKAPEIEDFIDLDENHYFIVAKFNIQEQEKRMLEEHPDWTKKQARCVLYWQSSVKKRLRQEVSKWERKGYVGTLIPEAMGVHVLRTGRKIGIDIKRNPEKFVYKIVLVGKEGNRRTLSDF